MARAPAEDAPEPDRAPGAPHPRETAALFGHAAAETAFLDAWGAGRLHHAWLLRGPRGVGKATFAYRAARALIRHGDAGPATLAVDPADPVARRVAAGSEPGLTTLRRSLDPRTGRMRRDLTVDEARRLRGFFNLTAADGGWRVAIVDSADDMNPSAANALLKMLEEPPARAVILLVAHAPGRLLPTIRSRCRTLDFAPLDPEDLGRALAAAGFAGDVAALAALSGGAPGEAVRLAAEDAPALYAQLARLLGGAPGLDRGQLLQIAEGAAGREAQARFALTLELSGALVGRVALAGAGAARAEATAGEARLWARLAPDAARARLWAEAAAEIAERGARARAVNLDPAGAILDMWLRIDAVAARAAAR